MQDNGTGPDASRLPPPATPPGSRRAPAPAESDTEGSVPDDAFISPDAPIEHGSIPDDAIFSPDDPVERSGTRMPQDAFFSPDEPVVRASPPTVPEDFEAVIASHRGDEDDDGSVRVTGIGTTRRARTGGGARFDDPHVEHLYARLVGLVKSVREKGEAGLRTTPEMSRFEATLRGYCVGYLAGLRENPDPDA